MDKHNCGTCVHWKRADVRMTQIGAPASGACRAHPPTVIPIPVPSAQGQIQITLQAAYPPVADTDQCGEYKKKEVMH